MLLSLQGLMGRPGQMGGSGKKGEKVRFYAFLLYFIQLMCVSVCAHYYSYRFCAALIACFKQPFKRHEV